MILPAREARMYSSAGYLTATFPSGAKEDARNLRCGADHLGPQEISPFTDKAKKALAGVSAARRGSMKGASVPGALASNLTAGFFAVAKKEPTSTFACRRQPRMCALWGGPGPP
jgi:hypothetical protein